MNEKQASVAARIAELSSLPMSELWTVWDRYFPRRPDYPNRTHVESRARLQDAGGSLRRLAPDTKASAWRPSAQNIPRSSCGPPRSSISRRARSCCANGASANTG